MDDTLGKFVAGKKSRILAGPFIPEGILNILQHGLVLPDKFLYLGR